MQQVVPFISTNLRYSTYYGTKFILKNLKQFFKLNDWLQYGTLVWTMQETQITGETSENVTPHTRLSSWMQGKLCIEGNHRMEEGHSLVLSQ
jgi:hypothetical protein